VAVGEVQNRPFQLSFNSSLKVDFQGSAVTSDGRLILVRELDERLGLSALMERHLNDSRRGKNTQLPLADLLRQSIYTYCTVDFWLKRLLLPSIGWVGCFSQAPRYPGFLLRPHKCLSDTKTLFRTSIRKEEKCK